MSHQEIEHAISTLENQRGTLGDTVVDTSLTALRHQLNKHANADIFTAALQGERKYVTVMFADISGFTEMSEKLDPEEVRGVINACFERLGASIDRYGGHIDKFIGDEIMALFGAPVAHENDPERALRAALEMMEALKSFNRDYAQQIPNPLSLHFGINSGLVIAGGIGTSRRQDYSVMGDTVNLAARLEDFSEAGEILVGENSYRLTSPFFKFESLPPVKIKGKARPVNVYRLIKAKSVQGGQIRGIEGLHSPLVGRTEDMQKLRNALQKLRNGHGSVISVTGEAGLGKSRLVQELRAADSSKQQAQWVNGRALSHADSAGYLVARHVLRNLLGISIDSPSTEAASILYAEINYILPEHAAEIYPYLAYLLEVHLDDEAQQRVKYLSGQALHQRILQATHDFILAKAGRSPVVMVWEDLHWADPSSLELLETLLSLPQEHSLLLLLVYRRPIKGSKIWAFNQNLCNKMKQQHTFIELPPLTALESGELLQNLLGYRALPDQVRNQIIAKAEGNPFYLEEVIRSLIDRGALVYATDKQSWIITDTLEQIKLPDTLQGIIMARIDQLNTQTKRVLQIASVIGRNFSSDVLHKFALKNLPEHLSNLENLDLISLRKRVPYSEYVFRHVFTQESVYGSLLLSNRRRLHLQIGDTLEISLRDNFDDFDTALTLAHHFEEAQDQERALKYLCVAAKHATVTYANREAKALYQRALIQLEKTDYTNRWEVLAELEKILDYLGERDRQADTLVQMQAIAELLKNDSRMAMTHNRRSVYFDKISEYQAAAEAAEVGLRIARRSGNEHLQAQSLNLLALTAWRRFDYRMVQHWAEKALDALKVIGDPAVRITSLFHLGKAGYRLGQYDLALRYTQAAQELAYNTDNRDGEAVSHMIQGWIYQRLGHYDRAEEHYQAKLNVRRASGARYGEATALSHLGWLAYDQRKSTVGLNYCKQALEISQSINDRENESYALSGMGLNYEQSGQLVNAANSYQTALNIHTEIGATTLAIFDRAGLARISLAQNNKETARHCITIVANWIMSGNAQKFWDPWIIYLTGYQTLTALQETETAGAILNEAHALLHKRAAEISDTDLRQCFLTKVVPNRTIEHAWEELQAPQLITGS